VNGLCHRLCYLTFVHCWLRRVGRVGFVLSPCRAQRTAGPFSSARVFDDDTLRGQSSAASRRQGRTVSPSRARAGRHDRHRRYYCVVARGLRGRPDVNPEMIREGNAWALYASRWHRAHLLELRCQRICAARVRPCSCATNGRNCLATRLLAALHSEQARRDGPGHGRSPCGRACQVSADRQRPRPLRQA
jgi:hypothetical protein